MIPLTQLKLIMCADTNVQDDKTKVEKACTQLRHASCGQIQNSSKFVCKPSSWKNLTLNRIFTVNKNYYYSFKTFPRF